MTIFVASLERLLFLPVLPLPPVGRDPLLALQFGAGGLERALAHGLAVSARTNMTHIVRTVRGNTLKRTIQYDRAS